MTKLANKIKIMWKRRGRCESSTEDMKGKRSKMKKRPKRQRQRMMKTQKTFENQFAPKLAKSARKRFMTSELLSVCVPAKALRGPLRQETPTGLLFKQSRFNN